METNTKAAIGLCNRLVATVPVSLAVTEMLAAVTLYVPCAGGLCTLYNMYNSRVWC